MPKFNPDAPSSIQEIFSLEGDYLRRDDFTQPVDTKVLADDTRPHQEDTVPDMGAIGLSGATADAYLFALSSELPDELGWE